MKRKTLVKAALALFCLMPCLLLFSATASATAVVDPSPSPVISPSLTPSASPGDLFPFDLLGDGVTSDEASSTVQILLLLTVLTLAPSILIMVTAFTRVVIVLSFTRNAMGTQQMPPNQVMIGLALFLTIFIMFPVFSEINETAIAPLGRDEITAEVALERSIGPLRTFMFEQINLQGNQGDLRTFMGLARMDAMPETLEDIPTHVLIPAFITSEIKTAFMIGFMIYIPFIVIDMVVASALMSMGMMMLPPVMISLPFKIMLFVLVDGWNLTITSLVRTFAPGEGGMNI